MAEGAQVKVIPLREFFEKIPPGVFCRVGEFVCDLQYSANGGRWGYLCQPEIVLYCDNEACEGDRFFKTSSKIVVSEDKKGLEFVSYVCKNCTKIVKTFALYLHTSNLKEGTFYKYGEFPAFGPPTPARLISLIGPERELFLKGRRAENQGMGIAAFAYYRRVIEDEKNRIFDEIIRVCSRLSTDQSLIDDLVAAKAETQFTNAVDSIKHAIPQGLLINGHNPLTLLYSALSEGLHAQTDEQCLEVATSIRIIMAEFAERMGQALKEEAELNNAVSRLLNKKSAKA